MKEYIDKIMTTSNMLTGIGFEMHDEWLGAILLAGLTEEYMPMIMGIEGIGQTIASERIVSKLLDTNLVGKSHDAFIARKGNKNAQAYGKKNKKNKKQKKCFTCKSTLHLNNECPERQTTSKEKKNEEKKQTAFIGHIGLLSLCKKNEWFIDSGASDIATQ